LFVKPHRSPLLADNGNDKIGNDDADYGAYNQDCRVKSCFFFIHKTASRNGKLVKNMFRNRIVYTPLLETLYLKVIFLKQMMALIARTRMLAERSRKL